jgi:Protein of unknown function (DUF1194)
MEDRRMVCSLWHASAAVVLVALPLSTVSAPAAQAQTVQTVDLVLVLAVDASSSINDARWDLERQGYAKAFRDPVVLKAIQNGPIGSIAITLVEWSSQGDESQVIPWMVISDQASADQFSTDLAELPRAYSSRTSITGGLLFSAQLLADAPFQGGRDIIDVSGDGPDNTTGGGAFGNPPDTYRLNRARDQLVAEGITINGLPILGDPLVRGLDRYYQANVIGGAGSFMIVAQDFDSFAAAILRKLVEEIA